MSLLENPPCWKFHLLEWSLEWRMFGISEWRMLGILQRRNGEFLDVWNSAMEDFSTLQWRMLGFLEFCNGGFLEFCNGGMEDFWNFGILQWRIFGLCNGGSERKRCLAGFWLPRTGMQRGVVLLRDNAAWRPG